MAHNPILTQEITNGHAARMRYSRFRASLLGLEPQRRNRTSAASKTRVSKKKKEEDSVKPKKEEEVEKKSGSGIGNIKTEGKAGIATMGTATIKSERRSTSRPSLQPTQPPAQMMTPAMMKTEPGLGSLYNQHIHHPSILSTTASPVIKKEQLPTTTTTTASTTPPMPAIPEPTPFGMFSATSSPFMDSHQRMQMRLLTPGSDSDAVSMQGFLPHSPVPSACDLFHHHPHHHHNHPTVGAGTPPLSAAATASSPFDFNQCLDPSSPSPWHSQQQHHQHHHLHSHGGAHAVSHHHHHPTYHPPHQHHFSQGSAPLFSAGCFGAEERVGYAPLDGGSISSPFCAEHHHHQHQHHHQHPHHHTLGGSGREDGDGPRHVTDALGLHTAISGAGGAVVEASLFRERELEMEIDRAVSAGMAGAESSQAGKHEWREGFTGV